MKNKYFKPVLAVVLLAVLIAAMSLAYNHFKPGTTKGSKEVVVEVVIPEEESKAFTLNTDAEFLGQALEEADLVKGSMEDYGLYITEVNGRVADDSKNEWWCITKGGEDVYTGVDLTPIADGEHYEITLTVY